MFATVLREQHLNMKVTRIYLTGNVFFTKNVQLGKTVCSMFFTCFSTRNYLLVNYIRFIEHFCISVTSLSLSFHNFLNLRICSLISAEISEKFLSIEFGIERFIEKIYCRSLSIARFFLIFFRDYNQSRWHCTRLPQLY